MMMDYKQLLKDFIVTELLDGGASGPLADDQDLLISGLVDSLGVVRMIAFIEQTMAVSVPVEDVTLENFQTIEKIASYIQQHVSSN
jgi:acyl carrier protein